MSDRGQIHHAVWALRLGILFLIVANAVLISRAVTENARTHRAVERSIAQSAEIDRRVVAVTDGSCDFWRGVATLDVPSNPNPSTWKFRAYAYRAYKTQRCADPIPAPDPREWPYLPPSLRPRG